MDAVGTAFRAIKAGEFELALAGGVESMSRAPFVMGKAETAFSRSQAIEDTTIGWRFVNPLMKNHYGVESMPETAENVAEQFHVSREDQDAFAVRSQQKTERAQQSGRLAQEITPVEVPRRKQEPLIFDRDEHPRAGTTLEKLAKLPTPFRDGGSVTAGNASGVNDGAAAMLVASDAAVARHGLTPMARILGMATAGVEPRIMGMGPVPATRKLLERLGIGIDEVDIIELNEAFAAQGLACLRELGVADDDPRVNPNGGAIALGHPLGMSGARLLLTAAHELHVQNKRYALCTMCVGVGQGVATLIERV
jgi:acetyl-CoA C-acetyltransferase